MQARGRREAKVNQKIKKRISLVGMEVFIGNKPKKIDYGQLVETIYLLFFKYFIYLFSERGKRREKERERNMCERNISWLPLT